MTKNTYNSKTTTTTFKLKTNLKAGGVDPDIMMGVDPDLMKGVDQIRHKAVSSITKFK